MREWASTFRYWNLLSTFTGGPTLEGSTLPRFHSRSLGLPPVFGYVCAISPNHGAPVIGAWWVL